MQDRSIPEKKSFKIGDMIARLTKFLKISHCERCERRRLILNDMGSLGVKETIRRLRDLDGDFANFYK